MGQTTCNAMHSLPFHLRKVCSTASVTKIPDAQCRTHCAWAVGKWTAMCSSSPPISRNIACHTLVGASHSHQHPVACRLPVRKVRSYLKTLGASIRSYSIQQCLVMQRICLAHMATSGSKSEQGQTEGRFANAQQLESWLVDLSALANS